MIALGASDLGRAELDALVPVVFGTRAIELRATEDRFAQACELARRGWQTLPCTGPRLLRWGGALASGATGRRLAARLAGVEAYAALQDRLCRRVVAALEAAGIPYVLLKGSALRYAVYDEPTQRCGFDLDLGVPRAFTGAAEAVVRDLGYLPAQWEPETARFVGADPRLRSAVERAHYELAFLVRHQVVPELPAALVASFTDEPPDFRIWHVTETGAAGCYCAVDIHHAVSHDIALDPFLALAIPALDGGPKLPPLHLQLGHLVFKLYWEGVHSYGKGLYQLADMVRIVRRIDAGEVASFRAWIEQLHLVAAAHYVLRCFERLTGEPPPAAVARFVAESGVPRLGERPMAENDLGDMWPKLLGRR